MKIFILSAVIFFQSFNTAAQLFERKIIHTSDKLSDFFTWRFPSFEEGTVLLKTGGSLVYKMNFNMLFCDMQFITSKGDTMEIANPGDIDSIYFTNSIFFFRDGYFEIIAEAGPFRLGVSWKASFAIVKVGAMGLPARNVSTGDYINYNASMRLLEIHANEDMYVNRKTEYFLIDKTGDLIKASKSNFLEIFNADKKNIEKYLKLNKPNFNKQVDLEKLFRFCTHT